MLHLQEAGLIGADVVQWDVHVVRLLTHHHGVSLAERAPAHVLSANADVKACDSTFKHNNQNKLEDVYTRSRV